MLTALTFEDQKNPVNWTDDCEKAFNTLKTHLCSSHVLKRSGFNRRFLIQADAFEAGFGAVMAQGQPEKEHPILYLSHMLQPRETRYSMFEKEVLIIKWVLESLRYYFLGRDFDLETDHQALTWGMRDHNSRLTDGTFHCSRSSSPSDTDPTRPKWLKEYLSRLQQQTAVKSL